MVRISFKTDNPTPQKKKKLCIKPPAPWARFIPMKCETQRIENYANASNKLYLETGRESHLFN